MWRWGPASMGRIGAGHFFGWVGVGGWWIFWRALVGRWWIFWREASVVWRNSGILGDKHTKKATINHYLFVSSFGFLFFCATQGSCSAGDPGIRDFGRGREGISTFQRFRGLIDP